MLLEVMQSFGGFACLSLFVVVHVMPFVSGVDRLDAIL
jgi:hypothetical protein